MRKLVNRGSRVPRTQPVGGLASLGQIGRPRVVSTIEPFLRDPHDLCSSLAHQRRLSRPSAYRVFSRQPSRRQDNKLTTVLQIILSPGACSTMTRTAARQASVVRGNPRRAWSLGGSLRTFGAQLPPGDRDSGRYSTIAALQPTNQGPKGPKSIHEYM